MPVNLIAGLDVVVVAVGLDVQKLVLLVVVEAYTVLEAGAV